MGQETNPGNTPQEPGDLHRFKWAGFLRTGEYEFQGSSSTGKRAGRTILWIVLGIVSVAAVVTVPLVFNWGSDSQGGSQGGSSGDNAGANPTSSPTDGLNEGGGSQGAVGNPSPSQEAPSNTPSASPDYAVEREGSLRLTRPDTPIYVDFDARGWARAIGSEAYEALLEEEAAKFDLQYSERINGNLSSMNERQFGVLSRDAEVTADICIEATGSAPWTSARMDNYGNAEAVGIIEGATLCAVTEEGRVVAATVAKINAPDESDAPYIDFSVKVWKPIAA